MQENDFEKNCFIIFWWYGALGHNSNWVRKYQLKSHVIFDRYEMPQKSPISL